MSNFGQNSSNTIPFGAGNIATVEAPVGRGSQDAEIVSVTGAGCLPE